MLNLPESPFFESSGPGPGTSTSRANPNNAREKFLVERWILALQNDQLREEALSLLSKVYKIRGHEDLAPLLWNSSGTIFILLKEITDTYRIFESPGKLANASSRVCNAIALLQCVASHRDTRISLINANIPCYLHSFLATYFKEIHYEHLRANSWSVYCALSRCDEAKVTYFLLGNEILPLFKSCADFGWETSKAVATCTIKNILTREEGMFYCSANAERYLLICYALRKIVQEIHRTSYTETTRKLLKNIIVCYLKLSEFPRGPELLLSYFPMRLKTDKTLFDLIRDDQIAVVSLHKLFLNLDSLTRQQVYNVPLGDQSRSQMVGVSRLDQSGRVAELFGHNVTAGGQAGRQPVAELYGYNFDIEDPNINNLGRCTST